MKVNDLKKYKEGCYSALSRDLTEFEKNFLFIAGGILAFSTTFIKDIVSVSEIMYLPLLFIAWTCIIFSMGLMMNSFLLSANASDQLLSTVEEFQQSHMLFKESMELTQDQWVAVTGKVQAILTPSKANLKKTRLWAVRFFIMGITFFALFVSLNLVSEKEAPPINNERGKKTEL